MEVAGDPDVVMGVANVLEGSGQQMVAPRFVVGVHAVAGDHQRVVGECFVGPVDRLSQFVGLGSETGTGATGRYRPWVEAAVGSDAHRVVVYEPDVIDTGDEQWHLDRRSTTELDDAIGVTA